MATITIAYEALVPAKGGEPVAQICATFKPDNAAAALDVFAGTYYDTITGSGLDPATSLDDFMASQIAHPGIIAALRAAARDGFFVYENASNDDVLYWGEIKPALEAYGYTVTIENGSGS